MAKLLVRTFLALLAGGMLFAPSANAAPITAEFSGSIFAYSDFPNGTPNPDRIGVAIYGYVVYNVANGETSVVEPIANGGGNNYVASKSGCAFVGETGCLGEDWGTGKPVVTEYRIVTPWGTIENLDGDFATQTQFGLSRTPNPSAEGLSESLSATRDDRIYKVLVDESITSLTRQFGFYLSTTGSQNVLFGDLWDLSQVPYDQAGMTLYGAPRGGVQLWNLGQDCADQYGSGCTNWADSFYMLAYFTNVDFRQGVHRVPEPTTFALLGLGLAGLAFTRRRKQ